MKSKSAQTTRDERTQRASGKYRPQRRSPAWLAWLALAALALSALPVEGRDQCYEWRKRTTVNSYGQRWGHAMAYDSDRGVVVLFGGERGNDGNLEYFDDTWEYDGGSWKRINVPGSKPSARSFHSMAYDHDSKRVVLAGGENSYIGGQCESYQFGDTWVYTSDGTNGLWVQLVAAGFTPRSGHALVFDTRRGVIMSVQGDFISRRDFCYVDTPEPYIELRGFRWLVPEGGLNYFRDRIWGVGAAFDESGGVVLAIGGIENLYAQYRPGEGESPLGQQLGGRRKLIAAAYDSWRRRVVVVGGVGDYPEIGEEVYEWDPNPGGGWVALPRLPAGQGRAGAQMVYDRKREVMVLTGGAGGGAPDWSNGGRYDDTWELWPILVPQTEVLPADAQADVCGSLTLRLRAPPPLSLQDYGRLRFQWRLDGVPIQDGLNFTGTATTNLTISPVQQGHAGRYDAVVWDDQCGYGARTSYVARVTVNPGLQWVFRTTNGPSARSGHAMAYDSHRRVSVVFGGRRLISGTSAQNQVVQGLNDLWQWDGTTWQQRLPTTRTNGWSWSSSLGWRPTYQDRPVQRKFHAMAYDSRRDRLVVYGGNAIDPDGRVDLSTPLADLWEWDGARWLFKGTNGPPRRSDGSMAFDENRGRIVFFGGWRNGVDVQKLDLWEWNGYEWYLGKPLPVSGYTQDEGGMVYDTFRKTVVYGPTSGSGQLWHFGFWNGEIWTSSGTPPGVTRSPAVERLLDTRDGAMAFDSARRRTVWFGGWKNSMTNTTGFFDGTNWTLIAASGAPIPTSRVDPAMAYDPIRQVTVLFGGDISGLDPSPGTNDTWELAAIDKPLIREAPVGQTLRLGETTQFRVAASGPGPFTHQWYRSDSGLALADTARFQGSQTDTLTITNTQVIDGGYYHVEVRNQCGATQTIPVALEYNPVFGVRSTPGVGFGADHVAGQLQVAWPQAGAVLEQALDPSGPWQAVDGATSPYVPGGAVQARFFRLRLPAGP